ncbi:MAG TPA: molybdenum cofactor guanylyltransferase MobA [Rhodanobacteraceae bacterium]|nr:molybdenum cofactor guanylyltransferase MobA [Rhodanobacteraceae bacterium]
MPPVTRPPILGAVLAGGEARRLGGLDKGLQPFRGRALVASVVDAIKPEVDEILIIANRHRMQYGAFGKVIADEHPGYAGPMAGIAAALEYAAERWALCVPVDCPTLPPELVPRLHQAMQARASIACAVVHDGERVQPLFALYRPGLAFAASQALADNRAVHEWQRELGALEVDFADLATAFANLNTPADFANHERP